MYFIFNVELFKLVLFNLLRGSEYTLNVIKAVNTVSTYKPQNSVLLNRAICKILNILFLRKNCHVK